MYVAICRQLAAVRDVEAQILNEICVRIVRYHDLHESTCDALIGPF